MESESMRWAELPEWHVCTHRAPLPSFPLDALTIVPPARDKHTLCTRFPPPLPRTRRPHHAGKITIDWEARICRSPARYRGLTDNVYAGGLYPSREYRHHAGDDDPSGLVKRNTRDRVCPRNTIVMDGRSSPTLRRKRTSATASCSVDRRRRTQLLPPSSALALALEKKK
ncbi:hypothetical protein B0H16DRAFT_1590242 [Mycena metata]|uniref:Uncharacterized protein n=1 Tax=Mycena metata TaxID=1033252 RepID=A0AAD7HSY2_9AGAR|nr:hypothetical protein B0H16DRAFT_1590242 [Mycena metata]